MVKLEEVPDEDRDFIQQGPKEDEDEWDTDDSDASSTTSSLDSSPFESESLAERLAALKDMIPPTYRKQLASASASTYDAVATGLRLGGKTLWIVSTSVLLLGLPWTMAFGEEQQVMEMEREMRLQQSANEVLVQQQQQQQGQQGAKPAL